MDFFSEANLTALFLEYAYSPMTIYAGVVIFLTLSSFGLPIPEEVVLVSSGFIAYMAHNPLEYPPPYPGAQGVNVYILATLCFSAVILSDTLVFYLGKHFGVKIFQTSFFKKRITEEHLGIVNKWYEKYGSWVCAVFRFTPGLRFPGHLSCGMLGMPYWKFILVDAAVALISVPTQVLLVATYGKVVKEYFKEFKIIILATIAIVFIVYRIHKWYKKRVQSRLIPE